MTGVLHPPSRADSASDDIGSSIFVNDAAEVHDVPMSAIIRPVESILDDAKVQEFVSNLQNGVEMTPIEVAWVQLPKGENYYFAFGGCHRWAAHKKLQRPTIRARLIRSSPASINIYLGASSPFRHMNRLE